MENYLYKLLYYKNRISYFTISRKFIRKLYTFPIFLISTFQYFLYLLQHFDTYLKLYKSKSMILISVSIKIPKSRYKNFLTSNRSIFLLQRNPPNATIQIPRTAISSQRQQQRAPPPYLFPAISPRGQPRISSRRV